MTLEDANDLLGLAQANFSYAFRTMTLKQKVMLVHSWAFGLQDIPADIVMMAFMQLTTTCEWFPKVKEIRDQVRKLRSEAADYFRLRQSQREIHEMLGETYKEPALDQYGMAMKYIIENTKTLEKGTELGISSALRGSYALPIGGGKIGFDEIGNGNSGYLPPKRESKK